MLSPPIDDFLATVLTTRLTRRTTGSVFCIVAWSTVQNDLYFISNDYSLATNTTREASRTVRAISWRTNNRAVYLMSRGMWCERSQVARNFYKTKREAFPFQKQTHCKVAWTLFLKIRSELLATVFTQSGEIRRWHTALTMADDRKNVSLARAVMMCNGSDVTRDSLKLTRYAYCRDLHTNVCRNKRFSHHTKIDIMTVIAHNSSAYYHYTMPLRNTIIVGKCYWPRPRSFANSTELESKLCDKSNTVTQNIEPVSVASETRVQIKKKARREEKQQSAS